MKHLRIRRKPSPALIVAIAALSVALVGTAVAGPIAEISLNKKEKRQIRKISRNIAGKVSNRRISKRAPGLAVARSNVANIANIANAANTANSANTAKTANSANTAKTADSASNADKLDGKSINDVAMWAFVEDNGTLVRSSGGITSSKQVTGRYDVNFPRTINNCAANATNAAANGAPNPLPNEVALAMLDADTVRVQTGQSADGTLVDDEFMIIVTC